MQTNKLSEYEINEINSRLEKEKVYSHTTSKEYIDLNGKENVIVIFVEGFSYDIISKELTPNIYNFINKSINVNNYYNHTAATFRGLRGQLTSSYQALGGYYSDNSGIGQMTKEQINNKYKDTKVTSIANILREKGYTTYFQTPLSNSSALNNIFHPLGFDHVFGYENYDKAIIKHESMSDKNSYELLYKNIKTIKQPFFYALYVRDTHWGMDSRDLKYKNGKNSYLNQFYNLDYWFGDFINKFNNTNLSTNTIIIFTSDHATYPSQDFVKTFNTKSNYFLDKIPFIIYKNGVKPHIIDADGKNTLSLAPTILDILNKNNVKNKFLGSSIFAVDEKPKENYIYAEGFEYISTKNNKMELINDQILKDEIFRLQQFGDK